MDTISIGAYANGLLLHSRLCINASPFPGTVEKEDSWLAKGLLRFPESISGFIGIQ